MEKTDVMKKDTPEAAQELLSIENLSIRFRQYENGRGRRAFRQAFLPVITDLNVTVRRGEVVAVVGASGSGKSLLAHAVLGLLPANAFLEGSIRYRGRRIGPQDRAAGGALFADRQEPGAGREKDGCGKGTDADAVCRIRAFGRGGEAVSP